MSKNLLIVAAILSACVSIVQVSPSTDHVSPSTDELETDPDNGGLILPDGFEAIVVVDSIGPARHIAVNDNGDIYVKLRRSQDDGSIVALRDTSNDGRADVIERFGAFPNEPGGFHTEAEIHEGHLYVSTNLTLFRYRLTPGRLVPEEGPDTLLIDDHAHGSHEHITKPVAFDNKGFMYVPFGAGNNACQEPKRTPGVPGRDPCPDLVDHGGVWRFDKHRKNQRQSDGTLFATGLRSVVGMDWNPIDERLYLVMHGRDDLHRLWPNKFTEWQNAVLPAEEFMRVEEGDDFGWPYCYYDQIQGKLVLAPEYGGDGNIVGRCGRYDTPLVAFPGHFAPNDIMFYRGNQFPDRYRNGAFVALHGSTIRNPYPQAGYFVAFIPFEDGSPSGDWEVFANRFAVVDPIENTSDAVHRPVGLATGPDGSLYITESRRGKIWRILFTGDRDAFGTEQLERMEEEKRTASNIRTPHEVEDDLHRGEARADAQIYLNYCAPCHQRDGAGAPPRYPPLTSEWVTGDKGRLISVIVNGLEGPIEVNGEPYDNIMPQHSFLSDEDVARVATYIRQNFGNDADAVTVEEVRAVRSATQGGNE